MLYQLFYPLRDLWFGFNLFKYITFRMAMASVTAFLISLVIGPWIIKILKKTCPTPRAEDVRSKKLPSFYNQKEGVPTMGGIIFVIAVLATILLWTRLDNHFVIIVVLAIVWLGFIGLIDDLVKINRKNSDGIRAKTKFFGQLIFAVLLGAYLYMDPHRPDVLEVPFTKDVVIPIGAFYIFLVICVIVGTSNGVNLTDGLDGLVVGNVILVALAYCVIAYASSHLYIAKYLNIQHIPEASEISVICAALAGASLGFLWFNAHPAEIFLGDTGALAIGGSIGTIAVLLRKEILLIIIGGIFFAETVSVMMQVGYFKKTGRRIFLMAPLHHHFQMKGLPESKITIRFWIIGIILAIIGVVSLKVR